MQPMLSPQDYRDVLVLSRQRSLKRAAAILAVDPSTAGRRLESIEARFGAPVFLRTRRGLEPTAEGARVVEAAAKIEEIELAFERELLARDPAKSGGLTITAAEWGVPLLTPIVVDLARSHPAIPLRLRIENQAVDLTRREADVALRVGRPTEAALAGRRIGVARYGLYAARDYLARSSRPRSLADLAAHEFSAFDHKHLRAENARWQAKLAGDARTVVVTNSMLSLVEAVRSGAGIAALPCVLADSHANLERVLPALATTERDLWIVFHRDLGKSRGVRAIVDALVAKIRPIFASR